MLSWRWFAARIGGAVVTLVGVTVVVFVVLRTIPGNAIIDVLGVIDRVVPPRRVARRVPAARRSGSFPASREPRGIRGSTTSS